MPLDLDITGIVEAPRHIERVFLRSSLLTAAALDAATGCHVLAKSELANPIGCFKGRGADLFCATALAAEESVVCASAGNFGQGLAYAANRRGHACTVFASEQANPVKIEAMRRLGADVRLAGADFDAAKAAARDHALHTGQRWVEDGAEPAIADGAGTIALELLDAASFDSIVVPLGNGALLDGIGRVVRALAPHVHVIAVVAVNAPAMKLSLEAGQAIVTARADTIADGIAVRVPIPATLARLRDCCDDVVAVSDDDLFAAMQLIHRTLGVVVEPAGAAGIAAILATPKRYAGQRVATILTGANIAPVLRQRLLSPPLAFSR
ncbi:pyridoxal-phosphate dependent enzyme [Dyella nitratireducens]|uniref:Threonine dehydratase n=1 Tax=Dyella nitratireducens TaxID=1849580 RepID=A0ABQ1G764_9GAMM|nr:pyridoxal-phosphate dependent enzyme [Dyella nitratireducens]GGA38069.1 threonine dehydratase [Dyella nitratireducens]GLQ40260.1 threonine dehydratase [Dyella nitratireducens]